jgi:hypothetical protein
MALQKDNKFLTFDVEKVKSFMNWVNDPNSEAPEIRIKDVEHSDILNAMVDIAKK